MKLVREAKNKDDCVTLAPLFDFRDPNRIRGYEENREYCLKIGKEFWDEHVND